MSDNVGSGIKFEGKLSWILYDGDGNIKDLGASPFYNRAVNDAFTKAMNAFDNGTFTAPIIGMGVGVGSGQNVTSTTLNSISTSVASGTGLVKSSPSLAQLQCVGSFSAMPALTLTEAGLFGISTCSSLMRFYNDSYGPVSIGGTSDTLTITWTITAKAA